jgi:ATP-dependent Lon protease
MAASEFEIPDSFSGHVRLFPLPNVVLFPGVVQALHLFELRYRQLMDDVVADDELITMALVKPDSDNMSMPVPEIYDTVCVGKVMTHAKLENGTYNILLAGVKRATIVEELTSDTPYRQARVELIHEPGVPTEQETTLRNQLVELFRRSRDLEGESGNDSIDQLVSDKIELGQLADLMAYASGLPPAFQLKILQTIDPIARAKSVISMLEQLAPTTGSDTEDNTQFPPGFSLN